MPVTIYHGSNVLVEKPQIIVSGFYKDFGFGFYCTNLETQARKWALTKRGDSVVSVFSYTEDATMKVLSFPKMTDEWLDFVVACRRGVKHDYDIVEGPMADQPIRLSSARKDPSVPLNMKGVNSYDKCIFS